MAQRLFSSAVLGWEIRARQEFGRKKAEPSVEFEDTASMAAAPLLISSAFPGLAIDVKEFL